MANSARNQIVIDCDICSCDFKDFTVYRKHVFNSQHKDNFKKILKNYADAKAQITCTVCYITCSGSISYNEHLQSDNHKKRNSDDGGSLLSSSNSPVSSCVFCGVFNLNSYKQYEDHIKSKRHEKNVADANSTCYTLDNIPLNSWRSCLICKIDNFTGPEPYVEHLNSIRHKNNVKKQTDVLLPDSTSDNSGYFNFTCHEKNVADANSACYTLANIPLNSWRSCLICKIDSFTGPEPYIEHVNSVRHKNNIKKQTDVLSPNSTSANSGYFNFTFPVNENSKFCKPCNKTLPSPQHYDDHMKGKTHLKMLSDPTNVASATSTKSSCSNKENSWIFCIPCGKKFNNQILYDQHCKSDSHKAKTASSSADNNTEGSTCKIM